MRRLSIPRDIQETEKRSVYCREYCRTLHRNPKCLDMSPIHTCDISKWLFDFPTTSSMSVNLSTFQSIVLRCLYAEMSSLVTHHPSFNSAFPIELKRSRLPIPGPTLFQVFHHLPTLQLSPFHPASNTHILSSRGQTHFIICPLKQLPPYYDPNPFFVTSLVNLKSVPAP